jgi:hypothetical protein
MPALARAFPLLVVLSGCGSLEGGVGLSSGTLLVEDAETGELETLRFDGGALTWTDAAPDGDAVLQRHVALTTWGMNFHCDYADVHLAGNAGRDIDRRSAYRNLRWQSGAPDVATIWAYQEGLFGGGSSLDVIEIDVQMTLSEDGRVGILEAEGGTLEFEAEDCGAL